MLITEKFHLKTPLWRSEPLSKLTKKNIYLKMECFQPTGSFKARGISLLCQEYKKEGKTELVASSGGNAGIAAAFAAMKLGMPITVFVPETTNELMRSHLRATGAHVIIHGKTFNDAGNAARAHAKEVDGGYVNPFDHPHIWHGHSTIIDELVEQLDEKPDMMAVSVGGGGLICGLIEGLHRHGWKDVPMVGVEPEGAASMRETFKAGETVRLDSVDTIVTSLASMRITQGLLDWNSKHKIIPLTASDRDSVMATRRLLDDHRVLVEPSCGTSLSTIYNQHEVYKDAQSIVMVLCGGVGVNYEVLGKLLKQFDIEQMAQVI